MAPCRRPPCALCPRYASCVRHLRRTPECARKLASPRRVGAPAPRRAHRTRGAAAVSVPAEGRSHPIGARVVEGGVNFSVFSEHASEVDLLLFGSPNDPSPAEVVPMTGEFSFWH